MNSETQAGDAELPAASFQALTLGECLNVGKSRGIKAFAAWIRPARSVGILLNRRSIARLRSVSSGNRSASVSGASNMLGFTRVVTDGSLFGLLASHRLTNFTGTLSDGESGESLVPAQRCPASQAGRRPARPIRRPESGPILSDTVEPVPRAGRDR